MTLNYTSPDLLPYPTGTEDVNPPDDFQGLALKAQQVFSGLRASVNNLNNLQLNQQSIPTGSDANLITAVGVHRVTSSQTVVSNLPTTGLGTLLVFPTGTSLTQMWIPASSTPTLYLRTRFSADFLKWGMVGGGPSLYQPEIILSTANLDTLPSGIYQPISTTASGLLGLPGGTLGKLEIINNSTVHLSTWMPESATPELWGRVGTGAWGQISGGSGGGSGEPFVQPYPSVALWGSSSSEYITDPLTTILGRYGAQAEGRGSGGEWSSQTVARIGSTKADLLPEGGSIPASGTVRVTSVFLDGDPVNLLQPCTGTFAGVHGTLRGFGTRTTNGYYEFTRTTSGQAVSVPSPVSFVPDNNTHSSAAILWAGKNDLNVGRTTAHRDKVIARINAAVAWFTAAGKPTMVLGHFVNPGTPASDAGRTQIEAVNADHATTFGERYLDVQGLLASPDVWAATGIAPTAEDEAEQALGNLPPSLTGVGNHLNDAANRYVSKAITERMLGLGWIGEAKTAFTFPSGDGTGTTLIEDPANPGLYLIGA